MSFKTWFLDGLQTVGGAVTRADLGEAVAPHARGGEPVLDASEPRRRRARAARATRLQHLGAYGPLDRRDPRGARALRREPGAPASRHRRARPLPAHVDRGRARRPTTSARRLLARFMREFKPEQVKRYLAREVIAGLPNAARSTCRSSPASMRCRARAERRARRWRLPRADRGARGGAGRERRRGPIGSTLMGRWAELDAPRRRPRRCGRAPARDAGHAARTARAARSTSRTRDGRRRVELPRSSPAAATSSARTKAATSASNGTLREPPPCEVWLEGGAWWVADAGSTNGIRVEPARAHRRAAVERVDAHADALRPAIGSSLSARAEGPRGRYPWLALRRGEPRASVVGARVHARLRPRRRADDPLTPSMRRPREARDACDAHARAVAGERTLEIASRRRCRCASAARAPRRSSSTGRTTASRGITSRSSRSSDGGAHDRGARRQRRHRRRRGACRAGSARSLEARRDDAARRRLGARAAAR